MHALYLACTLVTANTGVTLAISAIDRIGCNGRYILGSLSYFVFLPGMLHSLLVDSPKLKSYHPASGQINVSANPCSSLIRRILISMCRQSAWLNENRCCAIFRYHISLFIVDTVQLISFLLDRSHSLSILLTPLHISCMCSTGEIS